MSIMVDTNITHASQDGKILSITSTDTKHTNDLIKPEVVERTDNSDSKKTENNNMEAPINLHLPPELLSIIFTYVKAGALLPDPEPEPGLYHLTYSPLAGQIEHPFVAHPSSRLPSEHLPHWLPCISHVCKYWRTLALTNPALWNSGFPSKYHGVKTFLKRCRRSPTIAFEIDLMSYHVEEDDQDDEDGDQMWPFELLHDSLCRSGGYSGSGGVWKTNHGPKMTEFRVALSHRSQDLAEDVYIFLDRQQSMGNLDLKALELYPSDRRAMGRKSMPTSPFMLSPRVDLRKVRDLRLWSCSLRWGSVSHGLNNLASLRLEGFVPQKLRASFSQIMDVLKRSPQLEALGLHDCFAAAVDADHVDATGTDSKPDPRKTTPRVLLPNLHTLFLKSSESAGPACSLVKFISAPAIRNLTLDLHSNDGGKMVETLLGCIHLGNLHQPRMIEASLCPVFDMSVLQQSLFNNAHGQPNANGNMNHLEIEDKFRYILLNKNGAMLDFSTTFFQAQSLLMYSRVVDAVSLSLDEQSSHEHLQEFVFDIGVTPSEDWWMHVLRRATALRKLTVHRLIDTSDLLNALGQHSGTSVSKEEENAETGKEDEGDASILLPSLDTFNIYDWGLYGEAQMNLDPFPKDDSETYLHLSRCLKSRREFLAKQTGQQQRKPLSLFVAGPYWEDISGTSDPESKINEIIWRDIISR
jgi:hypothetical protein